ncbi:hypothetical protein ZOSMA_3G01380 [Zostera marina]|uniref:Uncharacterized protein n=1 Tax=Zostera marina TaxID=29655 RepID=A0A0K9P3Q2_ZOSMR|nr:hypothetical protein ZOSMA_3G01380 [Zostera marina]
MIFLCCDVFISHVVVPLMFFRLFNTDVSFFRSIFLYFLPIFLPWKDSLVRRIFLLLHSIS